MNRSPSRTLRRTPSRSTLTRSNSTRAVANAVQTMIAMQMIQEIMARSKRGSVAHNRYRTGRPAPNRAQRTAAARRRR